MRVNDTKKKEGCVAAWSTLSIEADGKAVGCGCVDWLRKYVIGDIRRQNLSEIWRCRRARAFRYALKRGKCPSICKGCGLYTSVRTAFSNKKLLWYNSHQGMYYRIK